MICSPPPSTPLWFAGLRLGRSFSSRFENGHRRILNSAERHATAELVLQRMAWEEGTLAEPPRAQAPFSSPAALPMDSAASDLLDALVLRVKGLREAISVRCVFAR